MDQQLNYYITKHGTNSYHIIRKKVLLFINYLHLIFLHPFRQEGHKPFVWSVACDMAVNSFIDDDMLFEDAITVKKIAERLKALIPEKKSAEFYYDLF